MRTTARRNRRRDRVPCATWIQSGSEPVSWSDSFRARVFVTSYRANRASRRSFSHEKKYPLIARFPARLMMFDDSQAMAPDERDNVIARHVAEVLVPAPRRPVRGGHLRRLAQHRERRAFDEEQRPRRREQHRHAG